MLYKAVLMAGAVAAFSSAPLGAALVTELTELVKKRTLRQPTPAAFAWLPRCMSCFRGERVSEDCHSAHQGFKVHGKVQA